ncbi:hypothetical protein Cch01nite_18620 [Cellulomonas chitinilytica]|uniref:Uncharacterized protein n=2 Tax=Cellulomonas chitinilytica TaxID=398759 RepID=A0A919P0N3_9CELL|nr:hypothetical protein Cch01nite_18620 [Cellulomonas chitinilytica]
MHLRGVRQVAAGTPAGLGTLPAETRHGEVVSPPIAGFPQGRLLTLLHGVLDDRVALASIAAAMNALTAEDINYGAAHWTREDSSDLSSALLNNAGLTGFILNATQLSQDTALAEQGESTRALIGFGRDAAGMIPIAGKLTSYGFGKALDAMQASAESKWASAVARVQDEQTSALDSASTDLQITTAVALMQHGHMLTDDSSLRADGSMSDQAAFPWMRGGRLDPSVLTDSAARDRMIVWMRGPDGDPMVEYVQLIDDAFGSGRDEHDQSGWSQEGDK